MDRVLNSIPNNLFIYYYTPSSLLLLLPLVISSKSPLLLLQEFPIEHVSFDRSNPYLYLALSSHLHCIFLFLFGLLNFAVNLNTLTIGFIIHIVDMIMLLFNVHHESQILNIRKKLTTLD
jgi:hypothetical protein